jgi:hypothetical protein
MTTGISEQPTTPDMTTPADSASPTGSLAKDAQSLPSGTQEVPQRPPMLQAMEYLLVANGESLKSVSHLLPSQSLSYLSLLMLEMVELHIKKAAGYSGLETPDTWRNFRTAEEVGVPAWRGVLIRKLDKVSRVKNLARDESNDQLGNESLRTTLRDDSAYDLIAICLLDEAADKAGTLDPSKDPETPESGRMRRMLLHEAAVRKVGE